MPRIHGLPPLADNNSRFLVLGTIPGAESLRRQEYYADSSNHFWRIMKELFQIDPNASYAMRKTELLKRGVALWDVLASCSRKGSLDRAIRNEVPNDLELFLREHQVIERIFFNGGKARNYARKHLGQLLREARYGFELLPSSSGANTHYGEVSDKSRHWSPLVQLDR